MLEAMALGVEIRARNVRKYPSKGQLDSVVVSVAENQQERYRGRTAFLRELIRQGVEECLEKIDR